MDHFEEIIGDIRKHYEASTIQTKADYLFAKDQIEFVQLVRAM